jgi:hypothetical protein
MRFNSVKGSDFSSSARAVNKNSDAAFDASRKSSFDFTGVSNAAIAARSTERRAAMKAEALKDQTQIKADTLIEGTKLKRDTDKAVADIKRPAKRMAGVVAGLGSIATAAVLNKENKEAKAERLKFKQEQAAITTKQQEQFNASQKATNEMIEQLQSTLKPTDTTTATTSDNTSSSDSSSTSTVSTGGGGGSAIRGEVYSYLTKDKGLSNNKALGLMANIDRESSFRTAPPGGDGGNSFGMFQWNNTYGRSDIMKDNVKDWQTNWRGQIDHALSGNQLPEYNEVSSGFLNTTFETPQQAADYWMTKWERPADTKSGSSKHSQFISGYNF